MNANPAGRIEKKKSITFDLHYIHGPREVVGLTEAGLKFLRTHQVGPCFYNQAVDAGLHVSFETCELEDRIQRESRSAIQ